MKDNAVYEKRSTYRRCCWYVHTEVLSRFGQEALPVPCQWTYLTAGAREESREEAQAATGSQGNSPTTPQTSSTTSSSSNKRKSTGSMSITKFMRRSTDPEKVEKHHADFTATFYFCVHMFCHPLWERCYVFLHIDCNLLLTQMAFNLCICQTEADGFIADTEDDEEDDCVIIPTQSGELHTGNKNHCLC